MTTRIDFNVVHRDQFNITNVDVSEDEKLALALKVVKNRTRDDPVCMEGTRADILGKVEAWLDNVQASNILWISGGPGTGKSAIASSIVSMLWSRERLASYFFFKRDEPLTTDPAGVWRSVAYDLALFNPHFKRSLQSILQGKVDPGTDIQLHFDSFIKRPVFENGEDLIQKRPVIVFDDLHVCGLDTLHAHQRKILLDTISKWRELPAAFKLVITSRDERLPQMLRNSCYHVPLLTGDRVTPQTNYDVKTFFQRKFAEIAEPLPSLPRPWPSETVLTQLTARAAGLFIWAVTVIRLVKAGVPDQQLASVLSAGALGANSGIDPLYRQILEISLKDATTHQLDTFQTVVGAIVLSRIPIHRQDVKHFADARETDIDFFLDKLSSVISVSSPGERIHVNHQSFVDFVCTSELCPEEFRVHRERRSQSLAQSCFRLMSKNLRFNIGHLATSYISNHQVPSTQLTRTIPTALSYACLYWADHLSEVEHKPSLLSNEIATFLHVHLLCWLEVLSLLGQVSRALGALRILTQWIGGSDPDLCAFATDARRLVETFQAPISESAPQIYLTALPFSPQESRVARHFLPRFPRTLSVVTGKDTHWPAMVDELICHTEAVHAIAISPNGQYIASGSADKTVCVSDIRTGRMISGPFQGHAGPIYAVAFSPCNTRVASASKDASICIWELVSGQMMLGPIRGHLKAVRSVVFLSGGRSIVSASEDRTICIWDTETGDLIGGPLRGHTRAVMSIAGSPDDIHIVSGSVDGTICIWNVHQSSMVLGPLGVHSQVVTSVAFSPDGKKIVTGSRDMTVSIWNARTGQQLFGPFSGHTDGVRSVAFSPDNSHFISGSSDKTICVWHETAQVPQRILRGHGDNIYSVTFSPDGCFIFSGSGDRSVHIWDAQMAQIPVKVVESYQKAAWSIAFSPDGDNIISGSKDGTVCKWDMRLEEIHFMKGHKNCVFSVAVSHDGQYVASASSDSTICIWHMETHEMVLGPFIGHSDAILSIAFSHDGKYIVSGSQDCNVYVWEVHTGKIVFSMTHHKDAVNTVIFSPSNQDIASGSADRTIYIYDFQRGNRVHGPLICQGVVWSIAFSPDKKFLASGLGDKTICLWNLETGNANRFFWGHTDFVRSVAFSPDGRYLASGSGDRKVCVWDIETGQVKYGPFGGHTEPVFSVAFSPNGKYVASISSDNTIRVWYIRSRANLCKDHHLDFAKGWVLEKAQASDQMESILFWVPPTYWKGICGQETIAIMGAPLTRLDLSQFIGGLDWTQCRSDKVV